MSCCLCSREVSCVVVWCTVASCYVWSVVCRASVFVAAVSCVYLSSRLASRSLLHSSSCFRVSFLSCSSRTSRCLQSCLSFRLPPRCSHCLPHRALRFVVCVAFRRVFRLVFCLLFRLVLFVAVHLVCCTAVRRVCLPRLQFHLASCLWSRNAFNLPSRLPVRLSSRLAPRLPLCRPPRLPPRRSPRLLSRISSCIASGIFVLSLVLLACVVLHVVFRFFFFRLAVRVVAGCCWLLLAAAGYRPQAAGC